MRLIVVWAPVEDVQAHAGAAEPRSEADQVRVVAAVSSLPIATTMVWGLYASPAMLRARLQMNEMGKEPLYSCPNPI